MGFHARLQLCSYNVLKIRGGLGFRGFRVGFSRLGCSRVSGKEARKFKTSTIWAILIGSDVGIHEY